MSRFAATACVALLTLLLAACGTTTPAAGGDREAMITSANPYATAAGVEMLQQGGSAVDAAIAAHAVLGLVEPQSSGIGGGGFMLVFDAADDAVELIDGRETAPGAAAEDMFLGADGQPLSYFERIQSGHAVGVPGAVALYYTAHQRHGRLDWATLFAPAMRLARDGFEVSPRLHSLLGMMSQYTRLDENPDTANYFFPDGEAVAVGSLLRNPAYGDTLQRIVDEGPAGFYTGPTARAILRKSREAPRAGTMTLSDIAAYEAKVRPAVCGPYRGYRVCSASPPSSGVAVLEILGLIEQMSPAALSDDADGWRVFVDAMKLGYADRDHYVADGDHVDVPLDDLANPRYWAARARQVPAPADDAVIGDPGAVLRGMPIIDRWGRDGTDEVAGTSHLSVIDADGNAVSFTASVESVFGSQRMAAGFILNNELTDFSSLPSIGGQPVANAVAPGKRPRSSMTPTLVFDGDGDLFMATGSPGGNSIIAYTVKSIIGVIDFGLSAADAVALPNVVVRGLPVRVENDAAPEGFVAGLEALGYPVDDSQGENSGIHPIVVRASGLEGAADPRREGVATRVTQ